MLACGIATFIGAPLAGTSNPFEWLLSRTSMKHSYKGDDYSDTVSSVSSLSFLLPDTTFIYREILKYVGYVWPRTVLRWQWNKYWTQCCILIMSDCAKRYTFYRFLFQNTYSGRKLFWVFFSVLSYASMIVDITYQDLVFTVFKSSRSIFVLSGWLYDITKSYDVSYISTGVALVLAGAILFIIPCIRHGKHKSW